MEKIKQKLTEQVRIELDVHLSLMFLCHPGNRTQQKGGRNSINSSMLDSTPLMIVKAAITHENTKSIAPISLMISYLTRCLQSTRRMKPVTTQ